MMICLNVETNLDTQSLGKSLNVETQPVGVGVLIFLLICFALFLTLTVDVTEKDILIYFGPGLIRKRFPLDSIKGARAVLP